MEQEIWKDVQGCEGLYQVSNLGNIKSLNYKRSGKESILKYWLAEGYKTVRCVKKNKKIHRLVAEAFIPKIEGKEYVNHKDGNKQNNNISNLEWCTSSENLLHKYKVLGYKGSKPYLGKFGDKHNRSKKVNQYSLEGKFIRTFGGLREAERLTGIKRQCIHSCSIGKYKQAGGFKWKY